MTNDRGLVVPGDMGERLRVLEIRRHPNVMAKDALTTATAERRERNKRYVMHSSSTKKVELPFDVSGYTEGISIRNNTGRSISLRGRDNTIIHLASNPLYDKGEKGIYYTVGFAGSDMVSVDSSRHDGVVNLTSNKLLHVCKGRGRRGLDIEGVNRWYYMSLDELADKGSTVYLEEVDKIISILEDDKIPDHPFAYTSVDEHINEAMREYGDATAGLILYTVDNSNEFGLRYINLNGNVLTVKPRQDPARRNGVYLRLNGHIGDKRQQVEFYEFDTLNDKCPIRFFATIAEAQNYGSELEEKKRQHELTKTENELEVLDAKRDQQVAAVVLAEKKDTIEATSIERKDRYEASSLARKDHYDESSSVRKDSFDERSTDRKDSSEEGKAVIATVGAAAAIGGIGYKLLAGGGRKFIEHGIGNGLIADAVVRSTAASMLTSTMVDRTIRDGVLSTCRSLALGGSPLTLADNVLGGAVRLLIGD